MVSLNDWTLFMSNRQHEAGRTLHEELNDLRAYVYVSNDFDDPELEPHIALWYYIHEDYLEPVYDFVNVAKNLNNRDIISIPDWDTNGETRLWFVVDTQYHTAHRIHMLERVMMDNAPDATSMPREDAMVPWLYTETNDGDKWYHAWYKMSPKEPDTHRLMQLVNAKTEWFLMDYALRLVRLDC